MTLWAMSYYTWHWKHEQQKKKIDKLDFKIVKLCVSEDTLSEKTTHTLEETILNLVSDKGALSGTY